MLNRHRSFRREMLHIDILKCPSSIRYLLQRSSYLRDVLVI